MTAVSPGPDAPRHDPASSPPSVGGRRPRRRMAIWISAAVAIVLAVFIAVLASANQASQQLAQSPLLGKVAPPLHGSALLNGPARGAQIRLADDRGKWVLVNFAASWCVPCQEEIPQLLLFAQQHRKVGNAAIVTVAYDSTQLSAFTTFLRARSVTWPAVDDAQAPVDWGVTGLPDSYLVNPAGVVIAKIEGGVVASQLDSLITKYSPAATGP